MQPRLDSPLYCPGWISSCAALAGLPVVQPWLDSQLYRLGRTRSCTAPTGLEVVLPPARSKLYCPGSSRSCTAPARLAVALPRLELQLYCPGWNRSCTAPAGLEVIGEEPPRQIFVQNPEAWSSLSAASSSAVTLRLPRLYLRTGSESHQCVVVGGPAVRTNRNPTV